MKNETSIKIARGSFLRIIHLGFNVLASLFLMPFIINSLGDRIYGLWILISSFLGFYWLLNIGLGPATQRYVSYSLKQNQLNVACQYINATIKIYSLIGIIALVITLLFSLSVRFFNNRADEAIILRTLIIILGANFALAMPMRVFQGVLAAHLRFDLISIVGLIKDFLRLILIVSFLKNGYGVIALAIAHVVTDAIEYIINYLFVRKVAEYFKINLKMLKKEQYKNLFSYSWITFGIHLTENFRSNIDIFIIASFVSAESITIYSIAYRLIDYFRQIITSAVGLLLPVFSRVNFKDDMTIVQDQFLFATKISTYIALFIAGYLIIFGKYIIIAWIGNSYILSYNILCILVIFYLFKFIQTPSGDLLLGLSRHISILKITSIEFLSSFIMGLILGKYYGVTGVALGGSIGLIVTRLILLPKYSCQVINLPISKYYIDLFICFLKGIIILFIFKVIMGKYFEPNIYRLALLSALITIIFASIIYNFGFNMREKAKLKEIIIYFLGRSR